MSDDVRLRARLQQFGLSAKQAAVYLKLVERGRAKPATIASETDVSKSYVYQICETLEEEGLVRVNDEQSPTTILARSPNEALSERMDRLEETMTELEHRYDRPALDMESLESIRARETFFRRARDVIAAAESEIYLALPLEAVEELSKDLREAVDRGVMVLLTIGAEPHEVSEGDLEGVATAARYWIRGMTVYLSSDLGRGIIGPASVLRWSHGEGEAIVVSNLSIAATIESAYLGTIWPAAEELFLQRPPPLPRTYDSIRPAVYDATLHRRRGRTVQVEAIAHPARKQLELEALGEVPPESQRRITGTITHTQQNLVEPSNTDFAMECGFRVETDEGTVSVGGLGASLEDYEAEKITLSEANRD
ncbi:TrmB family transcriptional regulator sugar-binding domain-containing protein [Haloarcula amylovorans]|uniref:TrmB family transcriptional regulator sugar-binding domain-containing protein n=1 Tax=Haloarcula amylovorans TaxID=2562280 RepID=UPI0010768C1F|nr:TrmB family transcriptional regulator sugar-binding domain-containing protein [Halomicroarcula amylolytica]